MDITEDAPPEPQAGETLVSTDTVAMETEQPSPPSLDRKKKKPKQSKRKKGGGVGERREEEEVGGGGTGEGGGGGTEEVGGDLDDLEFWLSKGDTPAQKKKVSV